jgi:small-conductance mechanosensitive channel
MPRAVRIGVLAIGVSALLPAQSGNAPPPALPNSAQLLGVLNQTAGWYGRLDAEGQLAEQPAEVLYVNDDRQLAAQIVARSFEFAKAYAQLLAAQEVTAASAPASSSARYQRLEKTAATAADLMRRDQAGLETLRQQLPAATGHDRELLTARIAEAESRLAMAQTRNETLSGMLAFINGSAASSATNDLGAQIAALEQTVPAASASNAAAMAAAAHKAPPVGTVALIGDLFSLNQKDYALQRSIRTADELLNAGRTFMTPLVAALRQLTKHGDEVAALPESNDIAVIGQHKAELDAVTVRTRQLSAAMLPLAKRRILLDSYKDNLTRWRASVIEQYRGELRRVIFRAVTLAVMLLLVFAVSALWRRVTFRYIQDVRRRHQFLLLRRIVTLVVVAGVIAVSFATDVGSLTTFAGFLTAGIAIALQDVILSVAGYFVIIGKYGIRVGDRVQIAHVSGEVLEVGLVWMYLMEFEPRGRDQLPTGRIVEFPNAVVFDHSAGIFKQLPGTRYLWQEVSVTVPAGADYHAVQQRMLDAVNSVFADYGDAVQQQHREMERMLRLTMPAPQPQSRLRVATSGVEVTIRYPVEMEHAADVDDRITAAVTKASGQTVTETE